MSEPASPLASSSRPVADEGMISAALARVESVAAVTADEQRSTDEVRPSEPRLVAWPGQPTKEHARAYAKLADGILDRLTPGEPACLMFVSPTEGGGTTGMLVPLAAALAQRTPGGVIALDANMRDPALARCLGVEATQGLAEVLQGTATWQEVLRSTSVERLSVVPGGRLSGPGRRLPERLDLGPLLQEFSRQSSLVLIDAASLSHREVAPMAGACTGAYLVVRLNHTTRRAVDEAVEAICNGGGRVLGSVLLGC